MKTNKGFTMIEILIVLVVAAIVVAGLMYVLSGSRRATRIADIDSQAQQNARVAIDFVTKDLRSVGYGIDFGNGQMAIVYAGPYDVVFNANIEPVPDRGSTPGPPAAIDVSASPASVPPSGTVLYAPATTYQTGAETVRFTLDSNNDGSINQNDSVDEPVEQTPNPYDYSLLRQVYGFDGSSNGGSNEPVALVRGPDPYNDGTYPHPLFTYWYDHDDDGSTPDVLWGDGSGNGELEQGEIAAITPVTTANLLKINRIGITATGIARSKDSRHEVNEGYREVIITSEVNVRRSRPGAAAYIRGMVFDDLNGDGVKGAGESGLSDVRVRLNTGLGTRTTATGFYAFRVDPGPYTVTEIDPVGYTSTTPNAVLVNAVKGGVAIANFGDRAIGGYGGILGKVVLYEQEGSNPPTPTEFGVPSVEIFLNTGDRDTTDSNGAYTFVVPVSSYTITMDVPAGYQAVGHTSVTRALSGEGDTIMVDFGLLQVTETGTIAGKVFEDNNGDGIIDVGEAGIENVMLRLNTGDSTRTDGSGDYSFTLLPGVYDVTEEDPGGYISTTINNVTGVVVQTDSTAIVNFGDVPATEMSFTVITLGETQRALCITSADLQEFKDPGNTDQEIILGTKYVSGISNLNVWKNNWETWSTPNAAIFDQDPWYSRTPNEDILSVDSGDINGDGVDDVVTGLTGASGKVLSWTTQTIGNKAGELSDTPSSFFISTGIAHVLSLLLCQADMDGNMDAIIGTEYSPDLGMFEVWFGDGNSNFTHDVSSDVYEWTGVELLNSVRSIGVARLVGSPAKDVVLGTASGVNTGEIEIFRDNGAPNGKFVHYKTIQATGEVNAIALVDMKEDSYGDIDIIAGTRSGVGVGWLELWHNNGDGTFGEPDGLGGYAPSDTVRLAGEVLCLGVEQFNKDVYPDVVVGLKKASAFSGEIRVYEAYGYLPSAENAYISPDIGEAITLTVNDFNEDYMYDIAVGTRTSLSQGHVVVFFNETE